MEHINEIYTDNQNIGSCIATSSFVTEALLNIFMVQTAVCLNTEFTHM